MARDGKSPAPGAPDGACSEWPNCEQTAGQGGSASGVQVCDLDCGACPLAAGDRDGGQLLGTRADAEGLRSGRPDPSNGHLGHYDGLRMDGDPTPVTRSPYDPWHSEGYLVRCLINAYGWYWAAPGQLRRPLGRKAVPCAMNPEGI